MNKSFEEVAVYFFYFFSYNFISNLFNFILNKTELSVHLLMYHKNSSILRNFFFYFKAILVC